jgi:uncharacterized protein (TIGR02266 family)
MERPRTNALEEYTALLAHQKTRQLSPEEEVRLELLRDVLLELGALPAEGEETLAARPARAEAVLDVSFTTSEDVVRAYSKNIGTGGLAIRTTRALPVDSAVELRIKLPDAPQSLTAQGRVVWSREDSMGVAFTQLPAEAERRLKELLVQDASLLKRVRSVLKADVRELLMTDVRELGKTGAPTPQAASAVEVDTRPPVLVRLSDEKLMALIAEVFPQSGLRVVTESNQPAAVVVVDTGTALEVLGSAARLGTRIVMVNVSGPDSLVGKLSTLRPSVFVRRPASAAAVLQAVTQLLSSPAAQ